MSKHLKPKMSKADAGRLGGLATIKKHGVKDMSKMGKLGGRPKNLNWSEIQELKSGSAQKIKK